jgi:hypothetical protein
MLDGTLVCRFTWISSRASNDSTMLFLQLRAANIKAVPPSFMLHRRGIRVTCANRVYTCVFVYYTLFCRFTWISSRASNNSAMPLSRSRAANIKEVQPFYVLHTRRKREVVGMTSCINKEHVCFCLLHLSLQVHLDILSCK